MDWLLSPYSSSRFNYAFSPSLLRLVSVLLSLATLRLISHTTHAQHAFSPSAPFLTATSQPLNVSNGSTAFCSTPHPLFAGPLNILFNSTFPTSPTLQPFPAASFLHHCPNLNSSTGSCCDQHSVRFAQTVVDVYVDMRNRLSDGLAQLTLVDLYYTLTGATRTNATGNANSTAHLNLTAGQVELLTTVLEVVQLWGAGAVNCSDHWMSYLTSTFCLACDPYPRYWNNTIFPDQPPLFYLQRSTCTSIYPHCSALFINFFSRLPQLLLLLQKWPAATPVGYNLSTEWWDSYDHALGNVAYMATMELTINLCEIGDEHHPHADCSVLFCEGGMDLDKDYFPHAFRGLQYGLDSRTLHFVLDAHAYIANMICILRLGYNATDWYQVEPPPAERTDGCPVSSNLLNLLMPHLFEPSPILSSSCVNSFYHQPTEAGVNWCPVPKWCWWDAAATTNTANTTTTTVDSYDGSSGQYELCDDNGLAWPWFHNTTSRDIAWPAYEVGCSLNLSRQICQLPPLPVLPLPRDVVDALFHRLFVLVVAVGLAVLLCVLACLCRRYRVERAERLEARVADERSGSEMELEWEEALMAGKRKQAVAGAGMDGAGGLATFDSPRSGRLWSNGW